MRGKRGNIECCCHNWETSCAHYSASLCLRRPVCFGYDGCVGRLVFAVYEACFWAWPPLVTGLPGLHDNAASADACR